MAFVQAQFSLPTVTGSSGQVLPFTVVPGRCPVDAKRAVRSARAIGVKSGAVTIRRAVPRTRPTIVTGRNLGDMGNWFSSLLKIGKGVAAGFATGGPAGAAIGAGTGIANAAAGIGKSGKGGSQVSQEAPQAAGPLANVSTTTLVVGGMAFAALVVALARGGR